MKSINYLVLVSSIATTSAIACNTISIEDATKKGFIKLIIKSKGGFTGTIIEMKIQNVSNQQLQLQLETGRRLDSKTETQQDILVTQPQELFLAVNQNKSFNVNGMCCQAHNSAPTKNAIYSIGKMADSNLVKLANYINENKLYENYSAQQAVWTVSDNNSIASIYGGTEKEVDALRNYISKITGRPIPKYDITFQQESDRSVLGRATKIEGKFDYTLNSNAHVTIAIYDASGKLVQLLFENIAHKNGDYKLYYTFRTRQLEQGIYYARMKVDNVLQKEEKIEF